MTPGEGASVLAQKIEVEVMNINRQVDARLPRGANALRNAELKVLGNPSPSAPGNPPGVRSGDLRRNWSQYTGPGVFGIESGVHYAGYLETGTFRMAARPFVERVKEAAMPKITSIFKEIG